MRAKATSDLNSYHLSITKSKSKPPVAHHYWLLFVELVQTPFRHVELLWGIVPLYFAWLSNELTSRKRSFRTATQTGFSFLWAAAQWTYQYFQAHPQTHPSVSVNTLLAVNVAVTLMVAGVGLVALVSGLRRKYPPYASFLGHTRFSNYFMIAIFPMQSRYLDWSWERVMIILAFAVPVWLLAHLLLLPFRR